MRLKFDICQIIRTAINANECHIHNLLITLTLFGFRCEFNSIIMFVPWQIFVNESFFYFEFYLKYFLCVAVCWPRRKTFSLLFSISNASHNKICKYKKCFFSSNYYNEIGKIANKFVLFFFDIRYAFTINYYRLNLHKLVLVFVFFS